MLNQVVGKPARPTMPAADRRKLAADRVRLQQEFERRSAELDREHTEHLAAAATSKRAAGAAWTALSDLGATLRAERDAIDAQLLAQREPEVAAFLEEMGQELAELPGLQQVMGFHIRHRSGGMDRTQRMVDNAASVRRRADAIRAAMTAGEKLTLAALEPDVLARRLAELRDSLPPVEDVATMAEAARRREQAAIDAA